MELSPTLQEAVEAFGRLPGIGRKTALRLVLHLLNEEGESVENFAHSVRKLKTAIQLCPQCHQVMEQGDAGKNGICSICSDGSRKKSLICVVENLRDLLAIEHTGQFSGHYHILGGLISPMDGVGPEDLWIESLLKRVEDMEESEVIMALSPTIEGDTTIFYLSRVLSKSGARITTLARGVAFGGELEYVDELTLSRSLTSRVPYEIMYSRNPG